MPLNPDDAIYFRLCTALKKRAGESLEEAAMRGAWTFRGRRRKACAVILAVRPLGTDPWWVLDRADRVIRGVAVRP